MSTARIHLHISLIALLSLAALSITEASAQEEPPRPTPLYTGSIGLDGTIDTFEAQTGRAIVKTADGIRQVFHLTSKTVVHGTKKAGEDTFDGLDTGSHVVVHYVKEGGEDTAVEVDRVGDDGLKAVEASVTGIDRASKTLAVELADGTKMTLRLTDRAAKDTGKGIARTDRVVIYYADDSGEHVAHYFKKIA